jgi:AcrR family transcriptional regulator
VGGPDAGIATPVVTCRSASKGATFRPVAIETQQDTRGRILDVALELFSEHGFDGTTLQQIADRLGFTKAALYYHFRSKDDLLDALHAPAVADIEELLDDYEDEPITQARRRAFVQDYLDYLLRHRRLMAYIVRDLASLARPTFASNDRRLRIEAIIAGGEVDFHEQIRVAMVLGGTHAVIAQYPDTDPVELREALENAAGVLLRSRPQATPSRQRCAPGGSSLIDRKRGR